MEQSYSELSMQLNDKVYIHGNQSTLLSKMAKSGKDPATLNFVHQNDILCETIRKEQKNQKLYTSYSINPFKKSEYMPPRNTLYCDFLLGLTW